MPSTNIKIRHSVDLLELLQESCSLYSDNYFTFFDRLEKATSAFYKEVTANLKRLDSKVQRDYINWLAEGVYSLKVTYDPDLLKMLLRSYSENPDSFPGYTNPVLISKLETKNCLEQRITASPWERKAMEATQLLQQLFVDHLCHRKKSELQEYLEKRIQESGAQDLHQE